MTLALGRNAAGEGPSQGAQIPSITIRGDDTAPIEADLDEKASGALPSAMQTPEDLVLNDDTLIDAMRSAKDKPFLLSQEQIMIDFLNDDRTDLILPLMNSYQRLLVHRCADYFLLQRMVDQETKEVTLSKTPCSRIPPLRLSQLFRKATMRPEDASPFAILTKESSNPSASVLSDSCDTQALGGQDQTSSAPFKIMRREPRQHRSKEASTSTSAEQSGRKDRKDMTIEEREAAYKKARERIFGATADESSDSSRRAGQTSEDQGLKSDQPLEGISVARAQSLATIASPGPGLKTSQSGTPPTSTISQPPLIPNEGMDSDSRIQTAYPATMSAHQFYHPPYSDAQAGTVPVFYPMQTFQHHHAYPSPGWQSHGATLPPSRGNPKSTPHSIPSSYDAFSPFPPTPSTTSSVGIPSPAPSVSGSSTSAAGRSEGRPRRDSKASSTESLRAMGSRSSSSYSQSGQRKVSGGQPSSREACGALNTLGHLASTSSSSLPGPASPSSSRSGSAIGSSSGRSTRNKVSNRSLYDPNQVSRADSKRGAAGPEGSRSSTQPATQPQPTDAFFHATANVPYHGSAQGVGYTNGFWVMQPASGPVFGLAQGGSPLTQPGWYYGVPPQPVAFHPYQQVLMPVPSSGPPSVPMRLGNNSMLQRPTWSQPPPSRHSKVNSAENETSASALTREQKASPGSMPLPKGIPGLPARPDWVLQSTTQSDAPSSTPPRQHQALTTPRQPSQPSQPLAYDPEGDLAVPSLRLDASSGQDLGADQLALHAQARLAAVSLSDGWTGGDVSDESDGRRTRSVSRTGSTSSSRSSSLRPSASASNVGDEGISEDEGED